MVERRSEAGDDGKMWEGPAEEVGRALVNYASFEVKQILGHQSKEIKELIGYADSEYVAQRESISFFKHESRPVTPSKEAMLDFGGEMREVKGEVIHVEVGEKGDEKGELEKADSEKKEETGEKVRFELGEETKESEAQ